MSLPAGRKLKTSSLVSSQTLPIRAILGNQDIKVKHNLAKDGKPVLHLKPQVDANAFKRPAELVWAWFGKKHVNVRNLMPASPANGYAQNP
jgi:hypothetical protein